MSGRPCQRGQPTRVICESGSNRGGDPAVSIQSGQSRSRCGSEPCHSPGAVETKIRNLMSVLFNHGRRHGFIDRNPISLVRQSARRQTVPDVLLPSEINRLLQGLHNRERTLVLLAAGTGLRMCELFGLKWRDIDFAGKQASVLRSIVKQAVGPCKTEASQKPVPLDPRLVRTLRAWRRCARFRQPTDWVFASPATQGSLPFWADFDAALHPADSNKVGHHQTNRLAHLPSFVFNAAKGKWRRHKGHARTASPRIHPCDVGHIFTGGNTGKASSSNGGRCTVLQHGKEWHWKSCLEPEKRRWEQRRKTCAFLCL